VKEEVKVEVEQEYMGVVIPEGKEDKLDDILDILSSYEGDIPVIIAMKGKKYNANCAIRKCAGLLGELKEFLKDQDIIFFKKKS
jgi:hypothetical protein